MELKGKKVLLVGLAKTGISTIKCLAKYGADITVNDIKTEDKLEEIISEIKDIDGIKYILGHHPEDISDIDMVVVSPGVPLDLPFIKKIINNNKELIGEVELAYRLSKKPYFVGITGTNGKTTTTSLTGEIFKKANKETYIVGNIGNPVIDAVQCANEKACFITELSSFQLESIVDFKPNVSAVLNITEDHMNRHHTMENYIDAKSRVFMNQDKTDFCVLNYDDEITRNLAEKCNANVVFFSRKEMLKKGVYLEEGNIIINIDKKINLMKVEELSLPGGHNLENCMAAIAMSYVSGIDISVIKEVLKTFKAVEHRLEFVKEINGIKYVNDSKGTNPDSTIKAVQAYENPIILIAGGYDKGSDYNELLEIAKKNVKTIVLMGETSDKIEKTAKNHGILDIHKVENMKEAVLTCSKLAKEGDVVLLSPACASWGMYNNFEERGKDFKDNVNNL
ncbi:UDP-N-acetylmuramoyl-L-alanine--D-glutamate ligase [Peptacetobacter sp.]|uniref:UDP-N-acetylmuramoyl-L-alanine--D-glutamate ligase n=1 Tax=Peptacetobacter sp. TaxID=2991975 RepID=UPI00261FA8CE|nr:UDP-N-acetylmuramoyl-L-alanine--D-glutamate ligase [Peptacetobacter sp.]